MKLDTYLASHQLTYRAFAEMIGVGHARTVERYAKGQRIPDGETMPKIAEVTGGLVTPNDFFDIQAAA